MIIKALKTFSDGVIAMHEGEITNVPDTKAQRFIAEGYAVEYTGEGGDIDLSAYAKKKDLENYAKSEDIPAVYVATSYGINTESTDNRQALQSLINTVNSNGGGTIYFPNGTYKFKAIDNTAISNVHSIELKNNVSIVGESADKTVFVIDEEVACTLFYGAFTPQNPYNNARFEHFKVDGSKATTWAVWGKAFYVKHLENVVFNDLILYRTCATALGVDFLRNVHITKVKAIECGNTVEEAKTGSAGIGIGTGKANWIDESFTISNCICKNCGHYGIFVESQTALAGGEHDGGNMIISHNIVQGGTYGGIGCRGNKNVIIDNNIVSGLTCAGIYIDGGKNIAISNNVVSENRWGVYVSPTFSVIDTLKINDNIVKNNAESGIEVGINVIEEHVPDNKQPYTLSNLILDSNNVIDNPVGVKSDFDIDGLIIVGNTIKDNANGIALGSNIEDCSLRSNSLFDDVKTDADFDITTMITDVAITDVPHGNCINPSLTTKCPYTINNNKKNRNRYITALNISGNVYVYLSTSPFYLVTVDNKLFLANYKESTVIFRGIVSDGVVSAFDNLELFTEINAYYKHESTARTLDQIVYANYNILDFDSKSVLVNAYELVTV